MKAFSLSWSLILGLLATTHWVSSVVYQDPELEAVVIDDDPDDSIELEDAEETTTQVPNEGVMCTNPNGIRGTCKTFQQCFPYTDGYDSGSLDSFQLYDILKESATPCDGDGNLVCCPDYSYGLPTRKPQFEGQTSERPSSTSASPNASDISKANGKNQNCGANQYHDVKVVGGRKAEIGEFPFAVALLNKGRQFCGGSIISDTWVLTAAHCIVNLRSFQSVSVNAGDHDISKATETQHQSRGVKRGLYNKHFSMRHLQHDVALLQLDKPLTLSSTVQPVCLNRSPPPTDGTTKGVLAGWGKQGKNLPPSSVLKTNTMRLIPHEECKKEYAKEPMAPPVTTGMVCAGEKSPLKDACNGDSGGPLSIFTDGKATQIGVVSWGLGCGDKPGVYTRVDQYIAWIDKNSKKSLLSG